MTLLDCWRIAHKMIITQHPIDQYIARSANRDGPPAYGVAELIKAEYLMGWNLGRHVGIRDQGAPRVAALWLTEPLVSLIKPQSEEGPPAVLTVLTLAMYETSCANGRYVIETPAPHLERDALAEMKKRHAKEISDMRAQHGNVRAAMEKVREALGAATNEEAVRMARRARAPEPTS